MYQCTDTQLNARDLFITTSQYDTHMIKKCTLLTTHLRIYDLIESSSAKASSSPPKSTRTCPVWIWKTHMRTGEI